MRIQAKRTLESSLEGQKLWEQTLTAIGNLLEKGRSTKLGSSNFLPNFGDTSILLGAWLIVNKASASGELSG